MDLNTGMNYLVERAFFQNRELAQESLSKAKQYEAEHAYLPVWVDAQTTKLVEVEKIKQKKLEIVKIKIPSGRLVWIERKNAIKRGFINE
jgi:hypothetical protein